MSITGIPFGALRAGLPVEAGPKPALSEVEGMAL
jgi:hypothetical protein